MTCPYCHMKTDEQEAVVTCMNCGERYGSEPKTRMHGNHKHYRDSHKQKYWGERRHGIKCQEEGCKGFVERLRHGFGYCLICGKEQIIEEVKC